MLSVAEFKHIVEQASVEDIRAIEVENLPHSIPEDIVECTDNEGVQAVLEDLLLEANAYRLRIRNELEASYGEEVVDALDRSRELHDSGYHMVFKTKLRSLIELYKEHRHSPAVEQNEHFLPVIEQLEVLFTDLKEEAGACARGGFALGKAIEIAGEKETEFREAATLLDNQYADLERTLNMYYYVRVIIIGNEMQTVRDEIERLDSQVKRLQVRVDVAREEIKHLQSSRIKSAKEKERLEELQKQVSDFLEDMKKHEIMISETELISWLDVIVEACMSSYVLEKAGQAVRSGRLLLFNLLQKYCEMQEAAAQQIARNPFSQSDPKKTIQFMLQSEQFILGYFVRKKTAMTSWLGGAAESKIEQLGGIEKQLLSEMKQNSKKLK